MSRKRAKKLRERIVETPTATTETYLWVPRREERGRIRPRPFGPRTSRGTVGLSAQ